MFGKLQGRHTSGLEGLTPVDKVTARLPAATAAVTSTERIGELDSLRGFALPGLPIANSAWFVGDDHASGDARQAGFVAGEANLDVFALVAWLVSDKANTLFAVLFGIGLWVQRERMEAGAEFARLCTRRLEVLLAISVVDLFLIWPRDILQL